MSSLSMPSGASEQANTKASAYRITRRRGACGACRSRKVRCTYLTLVILVEFSGCCLTIRTANADSKVMEQSHVLTVKYATTTYIPSAFVAHPAICIQKVGQECTYPEVTLQRRRLSGPRAVSRWSGISQTTTPAPHMAALSPTRSTWSMSKAFSWETTQTDLLSGLDLSSILETNDPITVPLSEDDGFFEFGVHSPVRVLNSFEDILVHNGQRQGGAATEDTQDGNYELRGTSSLDSLDESPNMTTYAEVCDLHSCTTTFSYIFSYLTWILHSIMRNL